MKPASKIQKSCAVILTLLLFSSVFLNTPAVVHCLKTGRLSLVKIDCQESKLAKNSCCCPLSACGSQRQKLEGQDTADEIEKISETCCVFLKSGQSGDEYLASSNLIAYSQAIFADNTIKLIGDYQINLPVLHHASKYCQSKAPPRLYILHESFLI